jgi:hypothetical protein
MISGDAPLVLAKASELFVLELALRACGYTEEVRTMMSFYHCTPFSSDGAPAGSPSQTLHARRTCDDCTRCLSRRHQASCPPLHFLAGMNCACGSQSHA